MASRALASAGKDPDFVRAAVRANPSALEFAGATLKADKASALAFAGGPPR